MTLVTLNASKDSPCNCVRSDLLPILGDDVPLDRSKAEFGGDAKNLGPSCSVRRAKVANRSTDCIFERGVAAGKLLTNTSGRLPGKPGMSHGVIADQVAGSCDRPRKLRPLSNVPPNQEERSSRLMTSQNFEQTFGKDVIRSIIVGERNLLWPSASHERSAKQLRPRPERCVCHHAGTADRSRCQSRCRDLDLGHVAPPPGLRIARRPEAASNGSRRMLLISPDYREWAGRPSSRSAPNQLVACKTFPVSRRAIW